MRDFKSYVAELPFDRIDTFRINRGRLISCALKKGEFVIRDERGETLPNGVLDAHHQLNSSAERVTSTMDEEIIAKLREMFHDYKEYSPRIEQALYKNALLFYQDGDLVGGINASFRQGLFESIEGSYLTLNEQDFEAFRLFFFQDLKHDLFEMANYHGGTAEQWRNYHYPNSFYFNPRWRSYETTINTPILCLNRNSVRAEIETGEEGITTQQLKRLQYVSDYPIRLKKEMFSMVHEFYNQMRIDFELPELHGDIENVLPFFVRLQHVLIPENKDDNIQLSFSSWDEEHGLYIDIHEDGDSMELT